MRIDIIKANKCFCYLYGPPQKGTFNSKDISKVEGEPQLNRISPLQALRLRVTAYKKAQAKTAAVHLIREDEDNNEDKGEGEDEALEVEFAAIKVILNQGNNIDNGDKEREINKDNE